MRTLILRTQRFVALDALQKYGSARKQPTEQTTKYQQIQRRRKICAKFLTLSRTQRTIKQTHRIKKPENFRFRVLLYL